MQSPLLKITVVSDLHCKHSSSDLDDKKRLIRSTILYSDSLRKDSAPIHPVHSFLQVSQKNKSVFKSDVLLCPGDITDKIDPQGYITGWSFLEEMRDAISAPDLYATIGNHDVDSRRNNPSDKPFTIAQSIKYNYPLRENQKLQFWSEHYFIVENDKYILLVFNSSHSHISWDDSRKAYIGEEVIKKMSNDLKLFTKDKIRLALCHHHPIGQSNVNEPDSDVIDKGTDFLDMLCDEGFSMIIHGHKHEPKIRYYNSLVVFCSGSFSSRENLNETESENVFHVIEFQTKLEGLIRTWYYGSNRGWHQKANKKFPPITGFGFNGNESKLGELSNSINEWFNSKSNSSNDLFANLLAEIKDVQFLTPSEMSKVIQILKDQYKLDITYDEDGIPKRISKLIL